MEDSMVSLEQAYNRIKDAYGQIDSFKIVKDVVNYRNFWKPLGRINVILLAESHVYTSDEDFKIELDYSNFGRLNLSNYPRSFVRFVYCIGYSEPKLYANKPTDPNFKNPGTWQYWKLFCACASDTPRIDCSPILKGSNPNFISRINKKITLLENLKKKGIWLVDSSIVGINRLPRVDQRKEIIAKSWNSHVKNIVKESKPQIVICIGTTVKDATERDIKAMGIRCDYIHQPQAHLTSSEREQEYRKLQNVCNRYCTFAA